METINTLLGLPPYSQLLYHYDAERRALWCYLNPKPRPCFTLPLLQEIRDLQRRLTTSLRAPKATDQVRYLVYASAGPQIFNLGGDVELFARLIGERDRRGLHEYGRICIDAVYANATNLSVPTLTTVALVQGTALGGGFEGALSCNTVIAEESAQMGFPEILFNLFPGMGAMSLLTRRIEPARAERLIESGDLHSGRALWDMGVVDELASDGEGVRAVNDFIRHHERFANGHLGIRRTRLRVCPISYDELLDVVGIWAEAALCLTPRDLRLMRRIAAAQGRLERNKVYSSATQPQAATVQALVRG